MHLVVQIVVLVNTGIHLAFNVSPVVKALVIARNVIVLLNAEHAQEALLLTSREFVASASQGVLSVLEKHAPSAKKVIIFQIQSNASSATPRTNSAQPAPTVPLAPNA
jgi:hypothetical protein